MFDQYQFEAKYKDAHLSKLEHTKETFDVLVKWTSDPKNILYFSGNVGNGKTYFSAAFYNLLIENKKHVRVYSEYFLFQELKMCMQLSDWNTHYRIKTIADTEFFILDDMGSTLSNDKDKSEWKKEMLFQLIDLRYSSGLPTLITSNLCKNDLKKLFHERFASRLYDKQNAIIELHEPDRRSE